MSKELIVSSGRHETRVAILEDDQVVELFHEREKEYSLAGSIHKGRVTRVLPGMQSAFVDIGLERDAFLYVSDFFEDNEEYDAVVSTVEEKVLKMERGGGSESSRAEARPEPVRQPVASTIDSPAGELASPEAPAAPVLSANGSAAAKAQGPKEAVKAVPIAADAGAAAGAGAADAPAGYPSPSFFHPRRNLRQLPSPKPTPTIRRMTIIPSPRP